MLRFGSPWIILKGGLESNAYMMFYVKEGADRNERIYVPLEVHIGGRNVGDDRNVDVSTTCRHFHLIPKARQHIYSKYLKE